MSVATATTIPSEGVLSFNGSIPVQENVGVYTELPVEGTIPTRLNVLVEGSLRLNGSLPLNATIPVTSAVPVQGPVSCRGEADFIGSVPVHGVIPIDATLPVAANLPLQETRAPPLTTVLPVQPQQLPLLQVAPPPPPPPPQLPAEVVTVQRFIRPAPAQPAPPPPRAAPARAPPPPAPRVQPPPPQPRLPPPLPAYVDPRPLIPHERGEKAHDFEYHREGKYSARRNSLTKDSAWAPSRPATYGGAPLASGPIVSPTAPIVGSDYDRAFRYTPNAIGGIDPRPPLSIERERVYDYEVHREGAYAKGHTFVGARPAIGLRPVLAGPSGGSYHNGQPII